jgi:hypothetical protein
MHATTTKKPSGAGASDGFIKGRKSKIQCTQFKLIFQIQQ